MSISRNDSKIHDACSVEFNGVPKDLTGQALTLHSHANGHQTQQNKKDICKAEVISKNCTCTSHHV